MRIQVENLWVAFKNKVALREVYLDLFGDGAQVVALIGPSGAGKSTFLRLLKGMVKPSGGKVWVDSLPLHEGQRDALQQLRRRTAMVYQNFQLIGRLTVLENVLVGRLPHMSPIRGLFKHFSVQDLAKAEKLLEEVGLLEHAWQRADALSGGQQQRVGIARALIQEPALILADEPISALDPKNAKVIMELLLGAVRRQGIPLLVTLHHLEMVRHYADRVVAFKEGRVFFNGPLSDFTSEKEKELYFGEKETHEASEWFSSTLMV